MLVALTPLVVVYAMYVRSGDERWYDSLVLCVVQCTVNDDASSVGSPLESRKIRSQEKDHRRQHTTIQQPDDGLQAHQGSVGAPFSPTSVTRVIHLSPPKAASFVMDDV